jgi:zinc protease
VAEVEAAIEAEFEKIKNGPIADWELEKARVAQRRSLVAIQGSSFGRAMALSQNAMFYNDPDMPEKRLAQIEKVTAADVQRVAAKYLVKSNRTVVVTMPKSTGRGGN